MKNKILFTLILTMLMVFPADAQHSVSYSNYNLSIGRGSSIYNGVKSQQFLLFFNLPNLKGDLGAISYEGDLNFELILENSKTTYLAGFAPMFRYEFELLNINPFIKAGIGVNFINSHTIDNRNIGGHFIFSDMISIGAKVFSLDNYSVEISYLFRHISNAGLFDGNEGFNSQYLVISLII